MKTAIIIGDSYNNTLGLIRSLGQAKVSIILLLVGDDRLFISKSKYLTKTIKCDRLEDCLDTLTRLAAQYKSSFLICSNDKAAKWVDDHESYLSKIFKTPMRGSSLGNLFDKPTQCDLASSFGIPIPASFEYSRTNPLPENLKFPILLKPANSNTGEKSDIHICQNMTDINEALGQSSMCDQFICQEYIEKDYEINLIGISTDSGVEIPGGIKKIRHYPTIYSPCSFGVFMTPTDLGIDIEPIKSMMASIGYKGPFSVEFLRRGSKNYFMEINFRHDGLAYTATAAHANLLKMYVDNNIHPSHIKPTYMMDLSIDYCHVKEGSVTRRKWLRDFWKTGCQLNFNRRDPKPTIFYYLNKFHF